MADNQIDGEYDTQGRNLSEIMGLICNLELLIVWLKSPGRKLLVEIKMNLMETHNMALAAMQELVHILDMVILIV